MFSTARSKMKGGKYIGGECSKAMSAWKSNKGGGMPAGVGKVLRKCQAQAEALRRGIASPYKPKGSSDSLKAQVEEHRKSQGLSGAKERAAQARVKIETRQKAQKDRAAKQGPHGPSIEKQAKGATSVLARPVDKVSPPSNKLMARPEPLVRLSAPGTPLPPGPISKHKVIPGSLEDTLPKGPTVIKDTHVPAEVAGIPKRSGDARKASMKARYEPFKDLQEPAPVRSLTIPKGNHTLAAKAIENYQHTVHLETAHGKNLVVTPDVSRGGPHYSTIHEQTEGGTHLIGTITHDDQSNWSAVHISGHEGKNIPSTHREFKSGMGDATKFLLTDPSVKSHVGGSPGTYKPPIGFQAGPKEVIPPTAPVAIRPFIGPSEAPGKALPPGPISKRKVIPGSLEATLPKGGPERVFPVPDDPGPHPTAEQWAKHSEHIAAYDPFKRATGKDAVAAAKAHPGHPPTQKGRATGIGKHNPLAAK